MRKIILLLLALPSLCYGQYGVPKKFSQIPVSTVPAVSSSDYFVGTHNNGDGTYTDYLYQPSSSIVDTVLGVTYVALDSGLLTRMHSLAPVFYFHGGFLTANTFAIVQAVSGISVMALPATPPDKTLVGVSFDTVFGGAPFTVVIACPSGAYIASSGRPTTDTLHFVGQKTLLQYDSANVRWFIIAGTPVSGLDKRYGADSVGGAGPTPVFITNTVFTTAITQISAALDTANYQIDSIAALVSVTPSNAVTLTNKRITDRDSLANNYAGGAVTYNTDKYDIGAITALATALTINVTGTPTVGQVFIMEIFDNGTQQTLTFGSSIIFGSTVTAPTITAGNTSKPLTIELMALSDGKWHAQGINQE